MGLADDSYAAAVAEIARVRAVGGTALSFVREPFGALDRIPPEIAGVAGLTSLDLDNTQVADLTPLARLTTLRKLGLTGTQVADLAPLAGLTALRTLWLNDTQVTDLAPLAGLTALQTLGLSSTRVADLAPLAGLTALQELWLTGTQVADLAPLAGLTALLELGLNNTQVADLAPLAGLTALQRLYLNNTQVADLAPLGDLVSLVWLGLDNSQIESIVPLSRLAQLRFLSFTGTTVADLGPLKNLSRLGAWSNSGLFFAGTPAESKLRDAGLQLAPEHHYKKRTRQILDFLASQPDPEPDFPITLEAVLTAQSPLGWRFSPEHGAMVIHMEAREATENQGKLARMSRERVGDLLPLLPNDPSGLRGQARTEAQRFADLLDDQSRDLSRRALELWGSLIKLGAILDENTVARADGRHPLDLLRAEERAALVTLLAIAGNLVRSFPDVQALDDSAGAFLRRAVTQETVAAMIEAALRRAFVEARSAALIQHVAQVGQGEGVQAQKAGAVTVRGVANLIRAASVVVTQGAVWLGGALVVGGAAKVGADVADHYELGRRAVAFIDDLRGQAAPLIDVLPPDEAAELRAALEDAEGFIDRMREGPH